MEILAGVGGVILVLALVVWLLSFDENPWERP